MIQTTVRALAFLRLGLGEQEQAGSSRFTVYASRGLGLGQLWGFGEGSMLIGLVSEFRESLVFRMCPANHCNPRPLKGAGCIYSHLEYGYHCNSRFGRMLSSLCLCRNPKGPKYLYSRM